MPSRCARRSLLSFFSSQPEGRRRGFPRCWRSCILLSRHFPPRFLSTNPTRTGNSITSVSRGAVQAPHDGQLGGAGKSSLPQPGRSLRKELEVGKLISRHVEARKRAKSDQPIGEETRIWAARPTLALRSEPFPQGHNPPWRPCLRLNIGELCSMNLGGRFGGAFVSVVGYSLM